MVALWPNSALSNRRRMIVIQAPVESPIRASARLTLTTPAICNRPSLLLRAVGHESVPLSWAGRFFFLPRYS
jgi:hypothetical protein